MKKFLSLVNFGMCTASIFPFIIGNLYSYYYYRQFNLLPILIFAISMLSLNFVVNILDNCEDYKEYKQLDENNEMQANALYKYGVSLKSARNLIYLLLMIFAISGISLVFISGWPILLMGIVSLFIGICYSQGKHPLSRYPIGEAASGLIMGFVIILAVVYLNTFQNQFNWIDFWKTFLVSLPCNMWISNILLANNICDEQADKKMGRRTIVYFIGKRKSLNSFSVNNVIALLAIVASVFLRLLPWESILILLLIPFIIQQSKLLYAKQDKQDTFLSSVKIMMLCSLAYMVTLIIGLLF